MNLYVLKVWTVAIIVYTLALPFSPSWSDGGHFGFFEEWIQLLPICLIFSLPSLVMTWILVHVMELIEMPAGKKYFVCLLVITLIPAANLIVLTAGVSILVSEIEIVYPAMISAFLSTLLFKRSFFRLFNANQTH